MNLPEKIIYLRKKQGWSQEELAEKLNVSRQSVSKWESGASTPELDRIVQICKLFDLTADALIRDDVDLENMPIEAKPARPGEELTDMISSAVHSAKGFIRKRIDKPKRTLTLNDTYAYIAQCQVIARKIALGVALCVMCPCPLLMLMSLFSEGTSEAIGVPILLVMVGLAVWHFVMAGSLAEPYRYIEKGQFIPEPGVQDWVRQSREGFRAVFSRDIALGVMLCVVSPAPVVFLSEFLDSGDSGETFGAAILLMFVAAGVYLFVLRGTLQNCYHHLLKEKC